MNLSSGGSGAGGAFNGRRMNLDMKSLDDFDVGTAAAHHLLAYDPFELEDVSPPPVHLCQVSAKSRGSLLVIDLDDEEEDEVVEVSPVHHKLNLLDDFGEKKDKKDEKDEKDEKDKVEDHIFSFPEKTEKTDDHEKASTSAVATTSTKDDDHSLKQSPQSKELRTYSKAPTDKLKLDLEKSLTGGAPAAHKVEPVKTDKDSSTIANNSCKKEDSTSATLPPVQKKEEEEKINVGYNENKGSSIKNISGKTCDEKELDKPSSSSFSSSSSSSVPKTSETTGEAKDEGKKVQNTATEAYTFEHCLQKMSSSLVASASNLINSLAEPEEEEEEEEEDLQFSGSSTSEKGTKKP